MYILVSEQTRVYRVIYSVFASFQSNFGGFVCVFLCCFSMCVGKYLPPLIGHTDRVTCMEVSRPIFVHQQSSETPVDSLIYTHAQNITLSSNPYVYTTAIIVTGSKDQHLRAWDLITSKCIYSVHPTREAILAVNLCLFQKNILVFAGSENGFLSGYEVSTGKKLGPYRGFSSRIQCIQCISPMDASSTTPSHAPLLIAGGCDPMVRIYNILSGELIHMVKSPQDIDIRCIEVGLCNRLPAFVSIIPCVTKNHSTNSSPSAKASTIPSDHPEHPYDLSNLSADGKDWIMLVAGQSGQIAVYSITSGVFLYDFPAHSKAIHEMKIIRMCQPHHYKNTIPLLTPLVVSCSEDSTIKIHNLSTGRCLCEYRWHGVDVRSVHVMEINRQLTKVEKVVDSRTPHRSSMQNMDDPADPTDPSGATPPTDHKNNNIRGFFMSKLLKQTTTTSNDNHNKADAPEGELGGMDVTPPSGSYPSHHQYIEGHDGVILATCGWDKSVQLHDLEACLFPEPNLNSCVIS